MTEGHRRIDRIRDPSYLEGLEGRSLEDVRAQREECLAEREYLSLLRRLVQGRAEILRAELDAAWGGRGSGPPGGPARGHPGRRRTGGLQPRRGAEDRRPRGRDAVGPPTVERLVADAGISDPQSLDDDQLAEAVEILAREEQTVSEARAAVISVLDTVQDELKRRYKEDPTRVLQLNPAAGSRLGG